MVQLSKHFAVIGAFLVCVAAQKNTIVQMFGYNWKSVAQECTQYLGPNDYGYVQVSPPQETIQGDAWWTDYQPVSYKIEGKRGNRDDFAAMVQACHAAGVKVLADAVINHMTGSDNGTGLAGTAFTRYDYTGVYSDASGHFHHCGLAPNDDIADYDNRQQVQTCQLSGLADLASGTQEVQQIIAGYLDDLRSLGVDGFRLDASKHMAAADISAILGKMTTRPEYISQEVIYGPGEPITPEEYVNNGGVQEFRYTYALKSAFQGGGIASLPSQIPGDGWLAANTCNVFVSNHDTERHGPTSLTYKDSNNMYTLAHVFMLAFPYGVPTVLSGYSFDDFDAGAPDAGAGSCYGVGGVQGWLCQHRWAPIEGMNAFHVAASGDVGNVQTGTQMQLAFSRGSTGFVAINNDDGAWSTSFNTSLPAGTYCNVYAGARNSTGCAGDTVVVDGNGVAALTVNPREAIAFYVGGEAGSGSPLPASPSTVAPMSTLAPVSVPAPVPTPAPTPAPVPPPAPPAAGGTVFSVLRNTTIGDNVFVVGSSAALGSWDTSKAVPLNTNSTVYPRWDATIPIADSSYEYKFIVKTANDGVIWEADPNRSGAAGSSSPATWQ